MVLDIPLWQAVSVLPLKLRLEALHQRELAGFCSALFARSHLCQQRQKARADGGASSLGLRLNRV